jgi:hypothetical protein
MQDVMLMLWLCYHPDFFRCFFYLLGVAIQQKWHPRPGVASATDPPLGPMCFTIYVMDV